MKKNDWQPVLDAMKQGKLPSATTLEYLSKSFPVELLSLGVIAWQSMKTPEEIIIRRNILTTIEQVLELTLFDKSELKPTPEEAFTSTLELGLLLENSDDKTTSYYFIHPTLQKYFAAYYMTLALQRQQSKSIYKEILVWIKQNKYNPHYLILLEFIAGFSIQEEYDQVLPTFWHTLLSPPHDIVQVQHLQLIVSCLSKAQFDERIPGLKFLFDEINQWMNGMLSIEFHKQKEEIKILSSKRVTVEKEIKTTWISSLLENNSNLLEKSGWKIPSELEEALENKNVSMQKAAVITLGKLRANLLSHPKAQMWILAAAKNKDKDIQKSAILVLCQLTTSLNSCPEALDIVEAASQGNDWELRVEAMKALISAGHTVSHQDAWNAIWAGNFFGGSAVEFFLTEKEEKLRELSMDLSSQPEVWKGLLRAASDENRNQDSRLVAIMVIGGLGHRIDTSSLRIVQKAIDSIIRKGVQASSLQKYTLETVASRTLGKLGSKGWVGCARITDLLDRIQNHKIKKYQIKDDDKESKTELIHDTIAVINALGKLGPSFLYLYWNNLLEVMDESILSSYVEDALKELGTDLFSDQKAWEVILSAAKYNNTNRSRRAAMIVLSGLGADLISHQDALQAIWNALSSSDNKVRAKAMEALQGIAPILFSNPENWVQGFRVAYLKWLTTIKIP